MISASTCHSSQPDTAVQPAEEPHSYTTPGTPSRSLADEAARPLWKRHVLGPWTAFQKLLLYVIAACSFLCGIAAVVNEGLARPDSLATAQIEW
jgi:hypothetical protein